MSVKPLESAVQVGIVHFMAFPQCITGEGPILETLVRIAEDPFFSAVELGPVHDAALRSEVATLLRSAAITVGYGCQPLLLAGAHDLNSADEGRRQTALDACLVGLRQAADLGAESFTVLSGSDTPPTERDAAVDRLVSSLKTLGTHCAERGIRLRLETFDRSIDKRCLVGPSALAAEVAARVRDDGTDFGLVLDLSHIPLLGESVQEAVHAVRDHIAHVHVGNCVLDKNDPLYGDHHPRFGYPGGENGVGELRSFLRELIEVGYFRSSHRASLAFEVKPVPGERSTVLIAQSQRTLVEAWATLELDGGQP